MYFKKLPALILTLIVLLSSAGCKKEGTFNNEITPDQTKLVAEKSISNTYTSKDEDIMHVKNLVEQSGWVYYHNSNDKNKLYKRNIDGSKNLKLIDSYLGSFCVEEEWIYYEGIDTNGSSSLYRIKTDGSINEKLNTDNCSSINISKEWVYYINSSDNDKLYKIKKDGSDRTKLTDDSVWSIYVGEGDWVYYINSSDNNSIYVIGMDGRERTKVTTSSTYWLCASEGWIYYSPVETKEINYPRIYKIKKDGSEETCLVSGKPHEVFVELDAYGDYIYYDTYNSDDALYRIKKDGTDSSKLTADGEHVGAWDISKNGLLFTSTFYNGYIYKMDLKSKKEAIINSSPALNSKHLAEWILYNDKKDDLGLTIIKKDRNDYNVLYDRIISKVKITGSTAYFLIQTEDQSNLYKLDINNPEPKMIAKGNILAYDISNGHIYYYDSSDQALYSIKTDGTEKKPISKNRAEYIQVDGEWIYFTIMDDGIYRMKLDGSEEQKLTTCNWMDSSFKISGDWIYFSDEKSLYRIKTDGTEKTRLYEDIYGIGSMLAIKDGRIYYENTIAEGGDYYGWINGFYSIKLDGTDKQTILEATFKSWAVDDNFVYYNKIVRDINIMKAKFDGTERRVIIPDLIWY